MTRITASTFKKLLEREEERFEERIDEWLEKEVLPSFKDLECYTTYLIKDDAFVSKFDKLTESLTSRGFLVERPYSGMFYVSLAVPPVE